MREATGRSWHLSDYHTVRTVLRDGDSVRQAGFNSDRLLGMALKKPVLFQEGKAHRESRTATARYFTPATVDREYRELMEELSERLIDDLRRQEEVDLGELTLRMAVAVAAQVVGLTDSARPGLDRRLESLVTLKRLSGRESSFARLAEALRSQLRLMSFYLLDVRPAIAVRRKKRRDDVISHLLDIGYKPLEILIECVTFGAAGMATTREFISMAAWHILEDEALRRRYLVAEEAERHGILQEILRLEPVVGRLYRRALKPLTLQVGDRRVEVQEGDLLVLDVATANLDESAVGRDPLHLCPDRDLARGVQLPVLSFGDGPHRCPGAFVAIQESDIFLRKLLSLPLRLVADPQVEWNPLVEGYELRNFRIRTV